MMLVVVIGDGGGESKIRPVVGVDCSGGGDRR